MQPWRASHSSSYSFSCNLRINCTKIVLYFSLIIFLSEKIIPRLIFIFLTLLSATNYSTFLLLTSTLRWRQWMLIWPVRILIFVIYLHFSKWIDSVVLFLLIIFGLFLCLFISLNYQRAWFSFFTFICKFINFCIKFRFRRMFFIPLSFCCFCCFGAISWDLFL